MPPGNELRHHPTPSCSASQMEREQRVCVVCQENEKSTLLMPCRHLCLCAPCAARPEVTTCPLCRAQITDRIAVYA